MSTDLPVYCLEVFHSGGITKIYGSDRSAIVTAMDKWQTELAEKYISITGICDSADRAELITVFDRESITAMTMWRHS